MQSRIQKLISLSALLLCGLSAEAQFSPADKFFHGGAQAYLTNNVGKALEQVTNGLALYPKDEKLIKLEQLLKQQQQQQQQQNQQQNQQSKDNQQQDQKQNQQQQNQQSAEQKKQEEQKKEEQKQAQQEQAKKSDEQKKQDEKDQAQAVAAGEMTPQEAKQLLDSQKNDEQLMPNSRKDKLLDQQKALKDW